MIYLLVFSCSEFSIDEKQNFEPVTPPGENYDPQGTVPDWDDCFHGYQGLYFNLESSHEDVEPLSEPYPQEDPARLDWWNEEYTAFNRYDPSLDFGNNWWPVDEGFDDDPKYFSVIWYAWIRVQEAGPINFTIGSADDFWLIINNEIVYLNPGIHEMNSYGVSLNLEGGQFPIEIRYAHRSGDSGIRFRVTDENATICYPEY